ncbi:MAG: hypothetical protein D6696_18165 [Acidobacteria bacterium]|nr:MAG: hypothetical protein D6696_18165 [Acidobacteriota bacterium]
MLLAVLAASLLLWARLLPRRRAVLAAALAAAVAVAAVAAVEPLRERVVRKASQLRQGQINHVLTGRLDGWRAAWWMLRQHPLAGVGHGAYRAEFAGARLALSERGVRFYPRHKQPFFANGHSEVLESAASWGWPGVAAMAWAAALAAAAGRRALRRLRATPAGRVEAAVLEAASLGLAVLVATTFVFHLALVAYPALLLVAALFSLAREEGG